ncbi:MAG TPA: M28 family peptidase [Candidatus Dormibacteraeota bacterium]|nr:M28 family peptidase [Candidatus Dormibacteraeota bacterium]
MKRAKALTWILLGGALALIACDRGKESTPAQDTAAAASASAPASEPLKLPPDAGPPPAVDGERAMQYVKDIVKFGPRPLGSANHKKVEEYISSHLKGDQVEDDIFTADTPEGKFSVHNIVAKYPGTKDGIIILASHYDTNYFLRNTSYVGANDGASSSGLLLELASHLRGKPRDGYSVWLVWDDAEEAMKPDGSGGTPNEMPFSADSLYGITHLAEKWQVDGTLKKVKAFILADMIGDADLNIDRDLNSTPWLEDVVGEAAKRLGYQSHFYERTNTVSDDHLPFVKRGVPCADLIDFTYGYNLAYWHTTEDTVDKLSPRSLQIVGSTILETIRILDKMDPLPPK